MPKPFIEAAKAVYVLKTKIWIDYKTASEIDLLIAVPEMVEVKTNKVKLTPKKIESTIIGEPKTGQDLVNEVQKAKERASKTCE